MIELEYHYFANTTELQWLIMIINDYGRTHHHHEVSCLKKSWTQVCQSSWSKYQLTENMRGRNMLKETTGMPSTKLTMGNSKRTSSLASSTKCQREGWERIRGEGRGMIYRTTRESEM
jgi:hypothetical protein